MAFPYPVAEPVPFVPPPGFAIQQIAEGERRVAEHVAEVRKHAVEVVKQMTSTPTTRPTTAPTPDAGNTERQRQTLEAIEQAHRKSAEIYQDRKGLAPNS